MPPRPALADLRTWRKRPVPDGYQGTIATVPGYCISVRVLNLAVRLIIVTPPTGHVRVHLVPVQGTGYPGIDTRDVVIVK